MILESAGQVLSHLQGQLTALQHSLWVESLRRGGGVGRALPVSAVETLLRFHGFSVEAAMSVFNRNPRSALDEAGLSSVALPFDEVAAHGPLAAGDGHGGGLGLSAASLELTMDGDGGGLPVAPVAAPQVGSYACIVCFDEVASGQAACQALACLHVTCDECLRHHVVARLEEGDLAGLICPEPSCRLTISEDVVSRLFGEHADQLSRLQKLRAQKFVDSNVASAWCPKPGCGRAVSLLGSEVRVSSQGAGRCQVTARCACGTKFCFNCKEIGGHEPVGCEQWQAFMADLPAALKEMLDATNRWLEENSRKCTCGAQIQRSGGCNHMICTVCARHFCYTCGADWAPHKGQPGGFDFYTCRLAASPPGDGDYAAIGVAGSASSTRPVSEEEQHRRRLRRLETDCLPGWRANARLPGRQRGLLEGLLSLADHFGLALASDSGLSAAREALEACLEARRCLRNCYVLRYSWPEPRWRCSRLRVRTGELEVAVGALESTLGLVLLEATAEAGGLPANAMAEARANAGGAREEGRSRLPDNPRDLLRLLDLRQLVPHAVAVSEQLGALAQLTTAVVLQTGRILHSGRLGFADDAEEVPVAAVLIEGATQAVNSGARLARDVCSVM